MSPFAAELIGTFLLVLLGDGVVANVVLKKTKGHQAGWIVVTAGWAFAVTVGVYASNAASGAHLNPAVTLGLASIGNFEWAKVPGFLTAQMIGAALGATFVWLSYLPHWRETPNPADKLGVFATGPAIRNLPANFITEVVGTFVLVCGVLAIQSPKNLLPGSGFATGFGPCLVGVLVWAIGVSLGGSTGYAINPARDLGPRIMHALLPIPGKGSSDWSYSWVPVLGPVVGGVLGALFYKWAWQATLT